MLLKFTLVILLLTALWPNAQAQSNGVTRIKWDSMRGVNYIPSYGKNLKEIWSHFDRDAFDRELALARKVGYNSIRLWLNYFAYRERGPSMVADVQAAIQLCRKHNLKVVIVLFDGCGASRQPNASKTTVSAAYDSILRNPRISEKLKDIVRFNYGPYAKGLGKDVEVELSDTTSPHVLLWQNWEPSPGYDRLVSSSWPELDKYVRDVVTRLAGDDTIVLWDIMNEPEWATEEPFTNGMDRPEVNDRVVKFLEHVRGVVKRTNPQALVTVGFATLEYCRKLQALSDVLTYHVYGEPALLEKSIAEASEFADKSGKPIVITETMANFAFMPFDIEKVASDDAQLKHYQKVVPTLLKSRIGWMAWGLIVGRIFNPYCDIFYANGYPRPAAVYLESVLKPTTSSL